MTLDACLALVAAAEAGDPAAQARLALCGGPEVATLAAEVGRLRDEVETLRHYGNKDCTAMADAALAAALEGR